MKKFPDINVETDANANTLGRETANFPESGNHYMILDLTEFTPFQRAIFDAASKIWQGDICTY